MNNQEILNGSKFDISEYIDALRLNPEDDKAVLTTILKELVKLFWQEKTLSQDNKGNIGTEQEGEIQEEIILEDKAQRERNQYDLKWLFGLSQKPHNPDYWEPNWDNWNDRIDDIQNLYNAGDKLYTLSVYDIVSNIVCAIHEQVKAQVDLSQELKETINKQYNAIIKLGDILHESDFKFKVSNDIPYPEIRKDYLHKLDGMDTLLVNLGDKKFIELAIAGSFFFDPRLVKKEIENLIKEFSVSENIRNKLSRPDVNLESSIDSGKAKNDVTDFVSEKISKIEKEQKDNLQKVNKLFNILTEKNFKEYLIKSKNLESDVNQQESKLEVYLANQFREEIKKVGESMPQDDEVFEYLKKTYNPTKKTIDGLKSRDKLNEYLAAKQLAKLDTFRDNQIEKMNYLKARYTIDGNIVGDNTTLKKGDKAVYTIKDPNSKEEIKFMVHIDRDGNRFVRNLITDKTGITVSQGKDSVLQNTIISHVWGRAYDPRYFTSLWNIVLVPAWANSLMDKEEAPAGTLASKMRATYMQLCTKLYNEYQESKESKKGVFPEKVEGNYLSGLPKVKNKEDIISGEFSFNVISESKKYIKIYTKNIEIEDQTTIKM